MAVCSGSHLLDWTDLVLKSIGFFLTVYFVHEWNRHFGSVSYLWKIICLRAFPFEIIMCIIVF